MKVESCRWFRLKSKQPITEHSRRCSICGGTDETNTQYSRPVKAHLDYWVPTGQLDRPIPAQSDDSITIATQFGIRRSSQAVIPKRFCSRTSCGPEQLSQYRLGGSGIESRGGEIFRTRPDWSMSPPSLLYNGYRVFPGVKRTGRGVDHPPHLAHKLKKEYSYTPTPPLGLRGLF